MATPMQKERDAWVALLRRAVVDTSMVNIFILAHRDFGVTCFQISVFTCEQGFPFLFYGCDCLMVFSSFL